MTPKLFDIHCHLNLDDFASDWQSVLDDTLAQDTWLINVGADWESSQRAVEMAQTKPEGIWATVGFHPTDSGQVTDEIWAQACELAKDKKVVAIGECGLEYYRLIKNYKLEIKNEDADTEKEKQKELFRKHIELAIELDKPLMIHCRPGEGSQDAYEEAIEILSEYKKTAGEKLRGDFHFFAGNWATAQKCLDLGHAPLENAIPSENGTTNVARGDVSLTGFSLSFTGVITFSQQYDEVIKNTPLDKLMAETDAPFVAPVPYRGKRCEPLYVAEVVKRLAEIKGISADEMAKITVANGRKMFNI